MIEIPIWLLCVTCLLAAGPAFFFFLHVYELTADFIWTKHWENVAACVRRAIAPTERDACHIKNDESADRELRIAAETVRDVIEFIFDNPSNPPGIVDIRYAYANAVNTIDEKIKTETSAMNAFVKSVTEQEQPYGTQPSSDR
jgi:hypothetical protein